MSKKHLILPVVACLMLAGCTLGNKTTKKKKKSSSVEITSVEPTSQGGQSTPAPSSANPSSQGGGASSNTQNPSSATPSVTPSTTPSVTPSTSSDVPPSDEWTADQISQFNSVLHYVPTYNEYTSGLAYFTDSDSGLSGFKREIEGTKDGVVSFLNGDGFVEDTSESWTDTEGDVHYVYVKEISDGYVIFDVCQYEDDGTWTYYYCYFTDGEGGGGSDDDPPAGSWAQCTTRPADGTDFIIGLNNGSSDVFLDGTMKNTYYPNCEATTETAIKFTVATSGEGFTLLATSGDVSGKYLGVSVSGTHVNAVYSATAYVWKWVDTDTYQSLTVEAHTFGAREDGGYGEQWYILAQQSGNTTVSPTYNKWWSSNFIARLYKQA